MSRTVTGYANWFVLEVGRVARLAHAELMRAYAGGPGSTELYLWFKRGALAVAADKPEGFELGHAERLPTDRTEHQLYGWIHDKAARLACLPSETGE